MPPEDSLMPHIEGLKTKTVEQQATEYLADVQEVFQLFPNMDQVKLRDFEDRPHVLSPIIDRNTGNWDGIRVESFRATDEAGYRQYLISSKGATVIEGASPVKGKSENELLESAKGKVEELISPARAKIAASQTP